MRQVETINLFCSLLIPDIGEGRAANDLICDLSIEDAELIEVFQCPCRYVDALRRVQLLNLSKDSNDPITYDDADAFLFE